MNLSYNINFSIASVVITIILILIVSLYYSSTNVVNKRYKIFLFATITMILLDIITVITNDYAHNIPHFLNMFLNGLYFLSGAVVAILFLSYCVSVAFGDNKTDSFRKIITISSAIILGLYGIALFVNNFTGFFFYFDYTKDFAYSPGPIYLLVNLLAVLFTLESFVIFVIKRDRFNKKQIVSTILFFASFFISFFLQLFAFQKVLLSDFGIAIGALIVFFSIETPDYIKLIRTLEELNELKASLEIQVKNRTQELDLEKKLYEELTLETLSSLAQVIDAKDHYTNGHSFRVAAYAKGIAEELGLGYQECEQIYFAGLIHDVGKIGIKEDILTKPGKLTDEEYKIIKSHSSLGGDILRGIKEFPIFEKVARNHHERYDGTGYPDKLKGEEISLEARIVAIADTFDAMTSDRSYRKALTDEYALMELERNKGTQFDPKLVDIFIKLYHRYGDSIRNHIDDLSSDIRNKNG